MRLFDPEVDIGLELVPCYCAVMLSSGKWL